MRASCAGYGVSSCPYLGWKKNMNPTNITAPARSTSPFDAPRRNIVKSAITTSGNPTPTAGPAAQGELFSGK
jgi:hypothetical protein